MKKLIAGLLVGVVMSAQAEVVWIDVRGADEYATGHLPGALLMPHEQIAELIVAQVPDKNADLHLYCRTGRRVEIVRDQLVQLGYTHITNHGSLENALEVVAQNPQLAQQ